MIEQICKLEQKINEFIDKKEYNYYALAPSQFGLRNPEDTPFSSMTKAIIIAKAKGSSPYRNTAETNCTENGTTPTTNYPVNTSTSSGVPTTAAPEIWTKPY